MPGIDTRMLDGTHDTPLFRGNSLEMLCSLEIRLFGPMEVHLCGVPIPRLRTRKGLWLLALLALRGGRSVERDWVAGTLWPDSNESNARRSLRQSLHDLRVALGHQAQRLGAEDRRSLRLDLAGAAVDVLEFDAAIGRGDLASLEAAVRLYRGPLLEDCAEEWGLEERRRREQEFVTTLERLATAAAARKEYAAAAGYLRPIVDLDPYREDSQRALMHVLAGGATRRGRCWSTDSSANCCAGRWRPSLPKRQPHSSGN
jgi:DNA-binding SARP family transcriptional activator